MLPRNRQPDYRNSERYHYETLLALFKNCVWGLTLFAGGVAFMTWNDLRDMRADITAQREKLLVEIAEEREFTNKEIEKIRADALTAAREKIVEIFQKNELESVVVEEATKIIEPKVKEIADTQIALSTKRVIDTAIADITSADLYTRNLGAAKLHLNADADWGPDNVTKIISLAEDSKTDENTRQLLTSLLAFKKSEPTTQFFKRELMRAKPLTQSTALNYLTMFSGEKDLGFYAEYIGSDVSRMQLVVNSLTETNFESAISLLNSKNLIDKVFANNEEGDILSVRHNLSNNWAQHPDKAARMKETYFFTHNK